MFYGAGVAYSSFAEDSLALYLTRPSTAVSIFLTPAIIPLLCHRAVIVSLVFAIHSYQFVCTTDHPLPFFTLTASCYHQTNLHSSSQSFDVLKRLFHGITPAFFLDLFSNSKFHDICPFIVTPSKII